MSSKKPLKVMDFLHSFSVELLAFSVSPLGIDYCAGQEVVDFWFGVRKLSFC
jgi:hypothetical protein